MVDRFEVLRVDRIRPTLLLARRHSNGFFGTGGHDGRDSVLTFRGLLKKSTMRNCANFRSSCVPPITDIRYFPFREHHPITLISPTMIFVTLDASSAMPLGGCRRHDESSRSIQAAISGSGHGPLSRRCWHHDQSAPDSRRLAAPLKSAGAVRSPMWASSAHLRQMRESPEQCLSALWAREQTSGAL
jgi:hypothetical protein